MEKTDLLSLNIEELENFISNIGEPKYRAKQIFTWLHKGATFDDMSNISKKTRELLSQNSFVNFPKIHQKLVSNLDGTIKYLYELYDGEKIESVFMKYNHGNTICISSQVGCRMGCKFCASTIGGLVRSLEPSELLAQVIMTQKDTGSQISNIVIMGIGEPLDNYDNVVKFLKLVNDVNGINIGQRHISLSTCGLVDKIYKLAEENLSITLSISLHGANNQLRSSIMPINNKWNLEELLTSCRDYFNKTGRRISFEYTLINDKNDSTDHAKELSNLLHKYLSCDKNIPIHVNLIPVNEVSENNYKKSSQKAIVDFTNILENNGINSTVRRKLGADIQASCGQLRHGNKNNNIF